MSRRPQSHTKHVVGASERSWSHLTPIPWLNPFFPVIIFAHHRPRFTKLPASRRPGSRKWTDRPGCPFCAVSQLFDELCVHCLTTRPVNRQLKRETPLSTLPTPWKLRLPSAIPLSAPALDQLQRRGVPAADRRHLLQLRARKPQR